MPEQTYRSGNTKFLNDVGELLYNIVIFLPVRWGEHFTRYFQFGALREYHLLAAKLSAEYLEEPISLALLLECSSGSGRV